MIATPFNYIVWPDQTSLSSVILARRLVWHDAGKKLLEKDQQRQSLTDPTTMKRFFQKCSEREKGTEPDWEEHKRLLLNGIRVRHS